MPALRDETPSRFRLPSIKGLLIATALVGGSAVLGVSTAAGSFATWNDSEQIGAGTIQAGTLGIALSGTGVAATSPANYTVNGAPWSALMPGDEAIQEVDVTNTGTTPATVTVSTAAGTSPIEVRVKSGVCSGTITGPSSTTTPTTLAGTLAGGATITVCIQVSLTAAAAQNQPAPFSMTFVADQVRP